MDRELEQLLEAAAAAIARRSPSSWVDWILYLVRALGAEARAYHGAVRGQARYVEESYHLRAALKREIARSIGWHRRQG